MNTKKFNFEIEGVFVIIEVECYGVNNEKVSVPLYMPIKGINELPKMGTDISVFEDEIRGILPLTLKGDFIDETFKSFNNTLLNHLKTYGRLLKADLEMYIGEVILIIIAIQKALNLNVISIDERISMFSQVYDTIMREINI